MAQDESLFGELEGVWEELDDLIYDLIDLEFEIRRMLERFEGKLTDLDHRLLKLLHTHDLHLHLPRPGYLLQLRKHAAQIDLP